MKWIFLLLLGIGSQLYAQPALDSALQVELGRIVAEDNLPGATAAVILPDGRLSSLAAGYADLEAGMQMPKGAQMLLGSVGKTFVAALVLQQVEAGTLRFDDKLALYFGEQDWFMQLPNAGDITVRMLLQHTSGLPRYVFQEGFLAAISEDPMKDWRPEEQLSFIAGLPPAHPAGQGWSYSDTNYLLLGLLLEKVTGTAYYTLLQESILQPLGLEHTYPSTQRELPGICPGYIGSRNILGLPEKKTVKDGKYGINPQFEWTGGGLVANVEDLAEWMFRLQRGEVASSRLLKEMRLPVAFRSGRPAESGYGLGCFVWKEDGGLHYGHEGIMPGYVTTVEYLAEEGLAIAIQVNTDEGFTSRLHEYVLRLTAIVKAQLENPESPAPPKE